jgi:hypothetical protein
MIINIYYYLMISIVIPIWFIIPSLFSIVWFGFNSRFLEYSIKLSVEYLLQPIYIIKGNPLIKNGIILSNHISIYDAYFDIYAHKCEGIARYLFAVAMLFSGLLGYIENYGIYINRNTIKSKELVLKIINKIENSENNVLLYPEGTRKKYYIDKSIKIDKELIQNNIKYGTLLEIYRNQKLNNTPIQIVITLNKEKISEQLYCYRSKDFYPKDFESQELYLEHILNEWILCYHQAFTLLHS